MKKLYAKLVMTSLFDYILKALKTMYIIAATSSEKAKDMIDKKIKKLILKDMRQSAVERAFEAKL